MVTRAAHDSARPLQWVAGRAGARSREADEDRVAKVDRRAGERGHPRQSRRCVPRRADAIDELVELAVNERVDLVVVGPELPLTLGLVDRLAARGILAFGPTRAAARLEESKAFMKALLYAPRDPDRGVCRLHDDARSRGLRRARGRPLVVKADGLAAGKGVVVASGADEALAAIDRMMRQREFGDAGATVVIEELLAGQEASFHVVTDGERFVTLAAAQDHKRAFDGDRGPNTGGMGAYAPAPIVTSRAPGRSAPARSSSRRSPACARRATTFRGVLFQ